MTDVTTLPAQLRQAAALLRATGLLRPQSAVVYERWAAHLETDARSLALLVSVLEPLEPL